MHEEARAFVVVQNRQVLKQLSDIAKPLFIERLHRSHQTVAHALDADFNIFQTQALSSSSAPGHPGLSLKPTAGWLPKI